MVTAFAMVEEVINNGPIAWRGQPDAKDPEAVTPAHFMLRGRIGASLLPVPLGGGQATVSKSLAVLCGLQHEFYQRFCVEMLPILRSYNK